MPCRKHLARVELTKQIVSLGKRSAWPQALERLKEDQGDVGLDVALCSAAVSACRSPGSWPQAHQLLTETRQLRVVPNCATYSGAIASSARSARGELNRCDAWAAGLGMLRAAFGAALRVNSICFGSAINGAPWPSGFQLLSVLQQCGLQGGAVTGNAAVSAGTRGLCWQQGLDLAESMIHRRLCSEITFNAAISAIAAGPASFLAAGFLRAMRSAQFQLDTVSYNAALSACKTGDWRPALHWLQEANWEP
eukprot:g15127.t2